MLKRSHHRLSGYVLGRSIDIEHGENNLEICGKDTHNLENHGTSRQIHTTSFTRQGD